MVQRASKQIFSTRVSGPPGIAERLLDVVGTIPTPRETKHPQPTERSRTLTRNAAAKAASAAGALALPPGPVGWLTIAPELYAVWKIQAQLVADIAGAHGKRELLTREQMLYCLFSHTSAGAFRQLVIRVGERYVVRRAPLSALYAIANKIAIRIAQRSAGRLVTRWIPVLGALGVAGYVYVDTGRVADTTMELFARDVKIEGELEVEGASALARKGNAAAPRATGAATSRGATRRGNGAGGSARPATGTKTAKRASGKRTASKRSAAGTAGKKSGTAASKATAGKRASAKRGAKSSGGGTRRTKRSPSKASKPE